MALVVLTEHVCPMCHSKNIDRIASTIVRHRNNHRLRALVRTLAPKPSSHPPGHWHKLLSGLRWSDDCLSE